MDDVLGEVPVDDDRRHEPAQPWRVLPVRSRKRLKVRPVRDVCSMPTGPSTGDWFTVSDVDGLSFPRPGSAML